MILSKQAVSLIREYKLQVHIAAALGCSEQWIIRSIKNNRKNGILTTVAAVNIIAEKTGLSIKGVLTDSSKTNKV